METTKHENMSAKQWEERLSEELSALEEAIGTEKPPGVVRCLAHTLATHPPLKVDEETMGRVVVLMAVAYSQGMEIEAQRWGRDMESRAPQIQ